MLTDLSYVKAELKRLGHAGWADVAKGAKVPMRTVKRIAYDETAAPRSDTVGKLAIFLRTRERRAARPKQAAEPA